MTTLRLNLVGCGRVGKTLGRLWHSQGALDIQDVLTRSDTTAQVAVAFIGAGRAVTQMHSMRPAELWMVATQDTDIAATASQLADAQRNAPPAVVFHGSGAMASDALAPLRELGWSVASAHCILSFATPEMAASQFQGTACALEGDPAACEPLRTAFSQIGAQCFDVASADKLLYHAAAVFATNFIPVLQSVAEDLWVHAGVPDALIPGLRASLLAHAVRNLTTLGPQGALTGPAARGDVAAIARQHAAVAAWSTQAGAAYASLSALALNLAQRGRAPQA